MSEKAAKRKRGMDLEAIEDQMLDLLILSFFPLRPDGKRGETAAQLIRGVFAARVRNGIIDPGKLLHPDRQGEPIPPEEYEGWDQRIGLTG